MPGGVLPGGAVGEAAGGLLIEPAELLAGLGKPLPRAGGGCMLEPGGAARFVGGIAGISEKDCVVGVRSFGNVGAAGGVDNADGGGVAPGANVGGANVDGA